MRRWMLDRLEGPYRYVWAQVPAVVLVAVVLALLWAGVRVP